MTGLAHHTGHRDRLREKLTSAGSLALHDYELLELYLFRCSSLTALPDLSGLAQLGVFDLPDHLRPWEVGGRRAWVLPR